MDIRTILTSKNLTRNNDSVTIWDELLPHPAFCVLYIFCALCLISVILLIIAIKNELYQYFCGGPQVHFVDSNREHVGWSNR